MGVDFSPTYLYTGQGILTREGSGILNLALLNGRKVGVLAGTNAEQNLQDELFELGATANFVRYSSRTEMLTAYDAGEIEAISDDLPLLSASIPGFQPPSEHFVLDEVLSKEALAMIVDENQSAWLDVVSAVYAALVQAEDLGFTQGNVDGTLALENTEALTSVAQAFLGQFDALNNQIKDAYGLSSNFAVNAIKAVGNYGEIYDRHFNDAILRRGANARSRDYGLHQPIPMLIEQPSVDEESPGNGDNGDNRIVGVAGKDVISGKGGNDVILGLDGNDELFGNQGQDRILGGDGNDRILGGPDNDKLIGGAGNDTLIGGRGRDNMVGDDGDDYLSGGDDHDRLIGGNGNDRLHGGNGNDVSRGNDGDDVIHGGKGNDRLLGDAGNDRIKGDAGNDNVRGGHGNDELLGGAGNDLVRGDSGDDILIGGAGNDILVGGQGSDLFVLSPGDGMDIIRDFEQGIDAIGLTKELSFGALSITQSKNSSWISLDDETLAQVSGVTSLGIEDFTVS